MNDHLDWVGASLFPKEALDNPSGIQDLAAEVGIPPKIWANLYTPEKLEVTEILKDTSKKPVIEAVLKRDGRPTKNQISKVMEWFERYPTLIDYVQEVVSNQS